jgi:FkbM family methyltransferase
MILNLLDLHKKYSMNINGVIHIGAHFGEEHQTYKELGIERIIYFEPVKKTFNVLKERVKDAEMFNYALGNENKMIEMHVEETDAYGCSSILEPSSNYDSVAFSPKEFVEMKTLDSFNFVGYNFLNIDVQGYESEVLKGSSNTLNNIDYIICEVNKNTDQKKLDYIGSVTVEKIIEFLAPYGFNLVEENWAGISWGDGFFIKNK